jgi:hypothetical protein
MAKIQKISKNSTLVLEGFILQNGWNISQWRSDTNAKP